MGLNSFLARSGFRAVLIWILLLGCSTFVEAAHLPKWEWGVGIGGLNLPAYRGAKGHKLYMIPIPYITYRGEVMRKDEDGMRGRIYETENVHLHLSMAANLPVPKDDDGARAGMQKLDPIVEVGTTLDFKLIKHGEWHSGKTGLWLRFPMRAAFSIGEPVMAHQGWFFSPNLDLSYRKGNPRSNWRASMSLGLLYGSRDYHEYFYKVPSKYATADRPEYQPDGGYSGSRATVSLVVNTKDWYVATFALYDDLNGAVFEDSPLVEVDNYFVVGFAISRIFGKSSELATH